MIVEQQNERRSHPYEVIMRESGQVHHSWCGKIRLALGTSLGNR